MQMMPPGQGAAVPSPLSLLSSATNTSERYLSKGAEKEKFTISKDAQENYYYHNNANNYHGNHDNDKT